MSFWKRRNARTPLENWSFCIGTQPLIPTSTGGQAASAWPMRSRVFPIPTLVRLPPAIEACCVSAT